jgi:ArsR family transcriptional regulator
VLAKRRDSTQIYYRIVNEQAASICRTVCTQMALGLEERPAPVAAD